MKIKRIFGIKLNEKKIEPPERTRSKQGEKLGLPERKYDLIGGKLGLMERRSDLLDRRCASDRTIMSKLKFQSTSISAGQIKIRFTGEEINLATDF